MNGMNVSPKTPSRSVSVQRSQYPDTAGHLMKQSILSDSLNSLQDNLSKESFPLF